MTTLRNSFLVWSILFFISYGCNSESFNLREYFIDYDHPTKSDIPFLIHQAISGHPIEKQYQAFHTLGILCADEDGKQAIIEKLSSNNAQLRAETLSYLVYAVDNGLIVFKSEPVLMQRLIELLEDENAEVRRFACGLVFLLFLKAQTNGDENPLGDVRTEIIDSIIRRLLDDDPMVRNEAALALIQQAKAEPDAIENLKIQLSDEYFPVRITAAVIDPTVIEAIPILQEGITISPDELEDYSNRSWAFIEYRAPRVYQLVAAQGLGLFGPSAIETLPNLILLLKESEFGEINHEDWIATQYVVAEAIVCIDPTGQQAIPLLIELLRDSEPSVRKNSALTLGLYGPTAASALTSLQELLSDPDQDVRSAAATALQQIEDSDNSE
jgi:HEAT repeat protein